jgi:dihydrofolate synthase/folylpolyglutamate synthase
MRINERIRVERRRNRRRRFCRALHGEVDRVAEKLVYQGELPWHPSFFEMMTAIAFEYFARQSVDIAVLEVGMGGRLDATNVVEPRVSVITDISLDHQKFLGRHRRRDCARKGGNHSAGRSGGDTAAAAGGE